MSKLTPEQKQQIDEAKKEAKELINNPKLLDQHFEEVFKKYDTNHDNTIDLKEYVGFLNSMLNSMGRKSYSLQNCMMNFDRADKDKNGAIDKAEFKKEFIKRLKEFAS